METVFDIITTLCVSKEKNQNCSMRMHVHVNIITAHCVLLKATWNLLKFAG